MPKSIFISYASEDHVSAAWFQNKLQSEGYFVFLDTANIRGGDRWEQQIERAIRTSLTVIVLVSPDCATSDWVMRECSLARQHNRSLKPVLIRSTDPLPWYLKDLHIEDFTVNLEGAFHRLLENLPEPDSALSLEEGRDKYLQRATLKSEHTVSSYHRAIELFFNFLEDRSVTHPLPIQKETYTLPTEIPLTALTEDDAPVFLHFAQWLLSPSSGKRGDKRPYKPSTVELRLAGVLNWFQFLDDYGWLPPQFRLAKAKRIVRDELRARPQRVGPPQPPEHIEEVIYYYDTLEMPKVLRRPDVDPARILRWDLTRLRNRALLHTLAETGGRISEVLSLNMADFPERYLDRREVLRVEVVGKGGHSYYLRFLDSLPAIRTYIRKRGANLRATLHGDIPLFVSHDPRYDGNRMSRVVAWRTVQRATRALGLRNITPHDFRHWRATQLINAGHSLDVVQDYLGHRSVETTRAYYAHTDPLRVDDAAKSTRLPNPETSRNS